MLAPGEATTQSPDTEDTTWRPATIFDDDDHQPLGWMEDFDDLTVDDLRELPHHLQLGLDLSVFD